MVPRVGVEPTWIAPHDFESCASANSAIRGCLISITQLIYFDKIKSMDLDELKLTDKRKSICERLNLNNSDDILSYYPFRYEMFNEVHYCDFK